MAATTARAKNVEAAVTGKPWTAGTLAHIDAVLTQDFQPMTDHRGTDAYRRRAAANLVRRLQLETASASETAGGTTGAQMEVWQL
jgi:xanthine dehydrogenase small subunit